MNFPKIIIWLVICGFLTQFAQGADLEAEKILAQSEQSLEKLAGFKVSYRAFQEHIAAVTYMVKWDSCFAMNLSQNLEMTADTQ